MQQQNVGRKYGPLTVEVSGRKARDLARTLGIEAESLTARNEIPVGVVPADGIRDLFAQMFDDLTDDGIGNSSRRLAAGTEYYYDAMLMPDTRYVVTGEILPIFERQGRTGHYEFGTLRTCYAPAGSSAPSLRVHTIFAERRGPAPQREKSAPVEAQARPKAGDVWRPPIYTNQSILQFVTLVDDRNMNHRDDDYARRNGFPSRIAPAGMSTFLLGEYVARRCGSGNVSSISVRLSRPIYPGQVIEITGGSDDGEQDRPPPFRAMLTADGHASATAVATLRRPPGT